MGNVVSRCAQEIGEFWRNCRSRGSEEDLKSLYTFPKENLEKYKIQQPKRDITACEVTPEIITAVEETTLFEKHCVLSTPLPLAAPGGSQNGKRKQVLDLFSELRIMPGDIKNIKNDGNLHYVGEGDNSVAEWTIESGAACGVQVPDVSSDPLVILEKKQEAVLKRLEELQQSVQKLSHKYGVNFSRSSPGLATDTCSPIQPGKLHDIVIQADPASPPLSLIVLYHEMIKKYRVLASSFVHCSVSCCVPQKLRDIFLNGSTCSRREAEVGLTLIWKKVKPSPVLLVNTSKQSPIHGEANIARYLARFLNPAYESGDIIQATQIDEWLDLCELQVLGGNSKEKAAVVRALNSRLGRNDWLVGSAVSLADIVMWSALMKTGQTSDVPANVKKWLRACNDNSMFTSALNFVS